MTSIVQEMPFAPTNEAIEDAGDGLFWVQPPMISMPFGLPGMRTGTGGRYI